VDLSWSLSSGTSNSGYNIYRSTSQASLGTSATLINLGYDCTSSGCSARDTNTLSRTIYWYQVVATNPTSSTPSNPVSVKAR
jgi:hypothetical protein